MEKLVINHLFSGIVMDLKRHQNVMVISQFAKKKRKLARADKVTKFIDCHKVQLLTKHDHRR